MGYRYFIELAYDGTRYHGWQTQDNALTVQEVITKAVRLIRDKDFKMIGCGRTDTGVNASQFYAHFDQADEIKQEDLIALVYKLNRYLPEDIVIYRIFPVPADLHSRYDAISRTYTYYIHQHKDPFLHEYSWFFPQELDVTLMNRGVEVLKEYEDFTSFSKANETRKTNLCTISRAQWEMQGHKLIFSITANRFLHDMVRAIVGTMIELGQHKINIEDLRAIIESLNRSNAGESVPAKGLFLTRVEYPGFGE